MQETKFLVQVYYVIAAASMGTYLLLFSLWCLLMWLDGTGSSGSTGVSNN